MKIRELLSEAAAKPKMQYEIVLLRWYPDDEHKNAVRKVPYNKHSEEALKKSAQTKFKALQKEHPTHFDFATSKEATDYMMSMEYPGYPMAVAKINGGYTNKYRVEPIEHYDVAEPGADDIKITERDGKLLVSVETTAGPTIGIIRSLAYAAWKAKLPIFNKSGKKLDIDTIGPSFKSNGLVIDGPREKVEQLLTKVKSQHDKDNKNREARKAQKEDPEYKKAQNKANYERQKERKDELHKAYGKHIVDRVKIKSLISDGDDGYQWSLWVDGRRNMSGMTKYQAEGEQRMMWSYLAKLEKMTPEERQKEADTAAGLRAYFLLDRLEKDLQVYLHDVKRHAKKTVDDHDAAEKMAKGAVKKAKDSSDPVKVTQDLIAKLRKKV